MKLSEAKQILNKNGFVLNESEELGTYDSILYLYLTLKKEGVTGLPENTNIVTHNKMFTVKIDKEFEDLSERAGKTVKATMLIFNEEGIDKARSTTNDIHEIETVLGIEAARNAIVYELNRTLSDQGLTVDIRHIMLVADMMTSEGVVKSIGRHGISGEKSSVLARAAFEETGKHLLRASIRGEVDDLTGIIENIIIGQPIPLGTGSVGVKMDYKNE